MSTYDLQYAGSSWDELQHIRQAVGFLVKKKKNKKTPMRRAHAWLFLVNSQVLHQKAQKSLEEITEELCPVSRGMDECTMRLTIFLSIFFLFEVKKYLIFFSLSRLWASPRSTALERCSGMINTAPMAYPKMWVRIWIIQLGWGTFGGWIMVL